MPVPAEFRGLWRRRSVAIDGAVAEEPALALWWQSTELFIDVRWGLDGPSGDGDTLSVDRVMTGSTAYEPSGFLTWHHQTDSVAGDGADRSAVHFDGADLVEVGRLDGGPGTEPRDFVEIWRRVDGEDPEVRIVDTGGVRVCAARAGGWTVDARVPHDGAQSTAVRIEYQGSAAWVLQGEFPGSVVHGDPVSPGRGAQ